MQNNSDFTTFNLTHLITLGIIFLFSLIFILLARHDKTKIFIKPIRYTLAAVLIGNELIFISGAIIQGVWSYKWGLPLQLCDLAILAVAFSLIKHNQFIWEIAYFWGLGGTVQALLTPDLRINFLDYIYFKFFITHGCIVIGVIFLAAGIGRPISFQSVKRVFIITNCYAAFIGVFNWLYKTNYLYLCQKPSMPSIIDFMGPWPYYFFGLEVTLIISLLFYYLPYYMKNNSDGRI